MSLHAQYHQHVLTIEHANPEAGNSFSLSDAQDLVKILSKVSKDCTALIWKSKTPRFFCTGGNLKFYSQQKRALDGIKANRIIRKALEQLANVNMFTIAIVDGDCFGGGIELLSCFDYVISSPTSFFGMWQRKIALSFGWGGGSRLLARWSHKKLATTSMLASSFNAQTALEIHLIDEIVACASAAEARVQQLVLQNKNLPKAPFATLKFFTANKESRHFEMLWFNKEHKAILEKFRSRK